MDYKSVRIKKCNCKHRYQDIKYGKGMRVCNQTREGNYRCTVCKAEHR